MDLAVVARQVVLGQEVDLEGDLRDAGDPRLVRRPWLPLEVATDRVGDVVVGEPLPGHRQVALQESPRRGLELDEKSRAGANVGRGPFRDVVMDALSAARSRTVTLDRRA